MEHKYNYLLSKQDNEDELISVSKVKLIELLS